ncbi:molecular chaperone DnaJ [Actinomyces sp. zg-332]|uniref:molecular chaperone DnaJ n=1 Tax=Actinomyces sp. zg-332 TaxID=2708340 RepID=UPI0014241C7D|nr:molecular chaperone DnaJ [Actinomyces sp. zg-332]QPK94484.1 molecular chaperone DnaJ [Actinomyces sp. zg-332]
MDYYEVLGVSKDATQDEIKKAYRKKARTLHPDVAGPDKEEEFKNVTVAYETLSNPQKKRAYDMGGQSPFGSTTGFGGTSFEFGDIFDTFFSGRSQSGPYPRAQKGQDRLISISLDLSEIAFGTEREIEFDTYEKCEDCDGQGTNEPLTVCSVCNGQGTVQKVVQSLLGQMVTNSACSACDGHGTIISSPCNTCNGNSRVRKNKKIKVAIPAGVEQGNRIRVSGVGEAGLFSGPNGDIYVEIKQKHHSMLVREGNDLHTKLRIPLTAAVLGTKFDIETLDGMQTVNIQPGTQSGETVKLADKGIGYLNRSGRGDLYVHVDIEIPKSISDEEKELFEKIANIRNEEVVEPEIDKNEQGFFSKLWEKLDL